jgi:hypothetical protein
MKNSEAVIGGRRIIYNFKPSLSIVISITPKDIALLILLLHAKLPIFSVN